MIVWLVMVEEALLERIGPRVDKPETFNVPPTEALLETTSAEVLAVFITAKDVVVAFVEVAFTVTRFVIVELAEFTKSPPVAFTANRFAPAPS